MIPKLYPSGDPDNIDFSKNGIGLLTDCISCIVHQELTDKHSVGEYEVSIEYPLGGVHAKEIEVNCWLLVKPNPFDEVQPFRIYSIKRTMFRSMIIKAEHISYGLDAVPVSGSTASNSPAALDWFNNKQAFTSGFELHSEYFEGENNRIVAHVEPVSARYLLNEFVDFFSAELKFNWKEITMVHHVGQDRGVSIRYGKNLLDISSTETFQNKYTAVYPYVKRTNGQGIVEYKELSNKIANPYDPNDPEASIMRAVVMDLSEVFKDVAYNDITDEKLFDQALWHMAYNTDRTFVWDPDLNIEMSYIDFRKSMEYNGVADVADVGLGDDVNVIYGAFGLNVNTRVISISYDALNEVNDGLTIGNVKRNVVDTLIRQQAQINKLKQRS